jgi:F-type H+-transporting ATPase subunit gamma
MSGEQLSDLRKRIDATRQLETVFSAMRGVAAARSRDAQRSLEGVRAYAQSVGESIQIAMALAPEPVASPAVATTHITLAFGSEQGFAGAFDERILNEAQRIDAKAKLYLVGRHAALSAMERKRRVDWSTPMTLRALDAPRVAERIAEALYDDAATKEALRVTLLHLEPTSPTEIAMRARPLLPLDLARFPRAKDATPPLLNLPAAALLAALVEEYVFAELCEATLLSFAAENIARVQAMTAARSNVKKTLDELSARSRRLRQEQITDELMELSRPRAAGAEK